MSDAVLIDSIDEREIRLSMTASNIQLPAGAPDDEIIEDEDEDD